MQVQTVQSGTYEIKPLPWGDGRLLLCEGDVEFHLSSPQISQGTVWQMMPASGAAIRVVSFTGVDLSHGSSSAHEVVLTEQRIHRIVCSQNGFVTDFPVNGAVAAKKAKVSKGSDEG